MKRRSFISRFIGASIALLFPWWPAYATNRDARRFLAKAALGDNVIFIFQDVIGFRYVNIWKYGNILAYHFRDWDVPFEQVAEWEKNDFISFWGYGNRLYQEVGKLSEPTLSILVVSSESNLAHAIHEQVFGCKMVKQMPVPTKSTLELARERLLAKSTL